MSRFYLKSQSWLALSLLFFISLFVISPTAKADTGFWEALQAGGKVVLLRHAAIDKTGSPFVLDESCFEERNLNALGEQQAKWLAQQFAKHQIQVDEVRTSPHCRTRQTAELAFPDKEVKVDSLLRLTKAISADQATKNLAATRELIAGWQGAGNLILVTHRPNIGELAYERVEPAGMVVIEMLDTQSAHILEKLTAPVEF